MTPAAALAAAEAINELWIECTGDGISLEGCPTTEQVAEIIMRNEASN